MAKAKRKTRYVCQQCGGESIRWLGRCPDCGAWNSLVEEAVPAAVGGSGRRGGLGRGGDRFDPSGAAAGGQGVPLPLGGIEALPGDRFPTGFGELDRVLGGGMVVGSLILLGGDPGIGKSTLALQVCREVAAHGATVLYVTGEESARQVKLRADRLGSLPDSLYILPETDLSLIEHAVAELNPALLIVDSIQTVFHPDAGSAPGSVGQVRESAALLMALAKSTGVVTFLVGHVTKGGDLAGPRVLEHMVDAVIYLEGERHYAYRILRGVKNRFGSTSEIGVFSMTETGLAEVANPSEIFLAERSAGVAGSVVVAGVEGSRPVLIEVQALLSGPGYGTPRRTVAGVDHNRLALLLAVLEKRVGLGLGSHDAYVKVVGGLRLDEPAADLGIALALASAFRERPVDPHTVVAGEVGLGGEVRAVGRMEARLAEASRLGFRRCLIPKRTRGAPGDGLSIELVGVETVRDAVEASFTRC